MTADRLLITGFPWHVFPVRCRDVARGITPHFQETECRVRHWSEPPDTTSRNPGACHLLDYRENGVLVVTVEADPPALPPGWTLFPARLEDGWLIDTGIYSVLLLSRVTAAGGDLCTFEATRNVEVA